MRKKTDAMTLRRRSALRQMLLICALFLSVTGAVMAQDGSPRAEVKANFGGATFIVDDGGGHHLVSGAVRVYVTKRFSIEPEFVYMRDGAADQDRLFSVNAAYDITDPGQRAVFYAIAGGGVQSHRRNPPFDNGYTRGSWNAGIGVKVFITKRLFVAPELRIGVEPIARATIGIGYVFAKWKE